MTIRTNRLLIRDFQRKDAPALYRIAREKEVVRFMGDWSDGISSPDAYWGFIDWLQTQTESTDVYQNKRYAVVLPDTDEMIGMVGMGLEETLNEVEVAYFISETHQKQGYATEVVNALTDWIFTVSDIQYLILTVDCANIPSIKTAERCGFALFEKRTPIGHKQPNMESDSYYYFRKYRTKK